MVVVSVLCALATSVAASTFTVGIDPSNPLSQSVYTDYNTGAQNVPVFVFNAAGSSGDSVLTDFTVTPTQNFATGDFVPASSINLMQNGNIIASQSLNGTSPVTFNHLNALIPSGVTQPFVLEVSVPAPGLTNNENGTTVFQASVTSVSYTTNAGNGAFPTSLVGKAQHFFSGVPNMQPITSSVSESVNKNGGTQSANENLTFSVTPHGGIMMEPSASDFTIGFGRSLAEAENNILPASQMVLTSITPTPPTSSTPLSQGQEYIVSLDATALTPQFTTSGAYQFYLLGANTTVVNPDGALVTTDQTWGLENFTSGGIGVTATPEPASLGILGAFALCLLRRRR